MLCKVRVSADKVTGARQVINLSVGRSYADLRLFNIERSNASYWTMEPHASNAQTILSNASQGRGNERRILSMKASVNMMTACPPCRAHQSTCKIHLMDPVP